MTSIPPPSKRQPSTSSAPAVKPQCKIHSTATVADKAQLIGPHVVEIGENVFIHPHAKIRAEYGNVTIGRSSMISEKAVVGASEEVEDGEDSDVVIGEGVNVQSGVIVEAHKIGDHSTVEVNARVGKGAVVGKWCKIGPMCEVKVREVVEDYTVVFGYGQRRVDGALRDRREIRDMKMKGLEKEIELLKTLIPDGSVKWTAA